MDDLYGELGVDRGADEAAIRRAYRRAAKKAHPDAGGSTEKFSKVQKALNVLTNPQAREQYDRTGEAGDVGPDFTEMAVYTTLMQTVQEVVAGALRNGREPETVNVISEAKTFLKTKLRDIDNQKRARDKEVKKIRKFAKRFRAKPGKVNRLQEMFTAQAADLERGMAAHEHDEKIFKLALEMFDDYEFDYDSVAEPKYPQYDRGLRNFLSSF